MVYLGFRGVPLATSLRNALTRACAHCSLDRTAGEWDVENAPAPRLYTALSMESVIRFPLLSPCFSLCSATLLRRLLVVASENTIRPLPEALPGRLRREPRSRTWVAGDARGTRRPGALSPETPSG